MEMCLSRTRSRSLKCSDKAAVLEFQHFPKGGSGGGYQMGRWLRVLVKPEEECSGVRMGARNLGVLVGRVKGRREQTIEISVADK